ncbi:MAG: hypothetical protein ACI9KE_002294 [Polyangiales bacterium]
MLEKSEVWSGFEREGLLARTGLSKVLCARVTLEESSQRAMGPIRLSMRRRLCLVVLVCACGGTNSDVVRGAPSSTEPAVIVEAPSATSDESPAPVQPTAPTEPTAEGASPTYDVSEREARRICDLEVEEGANIESCAFGVGHDLPGARVDLLELVYSDMGSWVSVAMLVLRSPEDMEYPNTFTIAEAREEPGMEEAFTLGTMSVSGTRITLPGETVSTVYPNTGEPDLPTGAIEERESFVVQCDTMNGVYECERMEP